MKRFLCKGMAWYLVAAMFVIGITPRVHAGFAPSEGRFAAPEERSADLGKVQKFLEMKMVRERLHDLGFTAEEIQAKLKDLSDGQIHQLAMKIDDLKTGGDGAGIVIALLVIAALVVLIIYLTGHRIIIK
jgi:hypothetical protein